MKISLNPGNTIPKNEECVLAFFGFGGIANVSWYPKMSNWSALDLALEIPDIPVAGWLPLSAFNIKYDADRLMQEEDLLKDICVRLESGDPERITLHPPDTVPKDAIVLGFFKDGSIVDIAGNNIRNCWNALTGRDSIPYDSPLAGWLPLSVFNIHYTAYSWETMRGEYSCTRIEDMEHVYRPSIQEDQYTDKEYEVIQQKEESKDG